MKEDGLKNKKAWVRKNLLGGYRNSLRETQPLAETVGIEESAWVWMTFLKVAWTEATRLIRVKVGGGEGFQLRKEKSGMNLGFLLKEQPIVKEISSLISFFIEV